MIATLIVLAKRPEPGKVKTRLVGATSAWGAAVVAAAALTDTLDSVDATPVRSRVLAFDGDVSTWLRPGWRTIAQPAGGLDHRLWSSFMDAGPGPAALIGMDTPQVTPVELAAFDLDRFDACLGPSTDGGYWMIGFREAQTARAAIERVPMSTGNTYDAQLTRLRDLGLRVQILSEQTDVDTPESADVVANIAPHTRFAEQWRAQTEHALAV
jgi:glycosyltransferase A (GT-A) superfamily protein (DUF2064 family)